jgi:dUTPase
MFEACINNHTFYTCEHVVFEIKYFTRLIMPHKSNPKLKRCARFLMLVRWSKTNGAVKYIILSKVAFILKSRETRTMSTGQTLRIPDGYYGHLKRPSSEVRTSGLMMGGGIVVNDGIGEVQLVLYNSTNKPLQIGFGDVLASVKVKCRGSDL